MRGQGAGKRVAKHEEEAIRHKGRRQIRHAGRAQLRQTRREDAKELKHEEAVAGSGRRGKVPDGEVPEQPVDEATEDDVGQLHDDGRQHEDDPMVRQAGFFPLHKDLAETGEAGLDHEAQGRADDEGHEGGEDSVVGAPLVVGGLEIRQRIEERVADVQQ